MSFDEQPDGDPHGECAAEIDKLTSENACMKWGLECAQRFVALWEQGEISAEGVLPQIKLDIERGLASVEIDRLKSRLRYIATAQPSSGEPAWHFIDRIQAVAASGATMTGAK